ncbi:Intraflagellar transport protein 81 [Kappamyces sp. JEL0680]|nr:Intraflagellar transport protein 81 [Kappamyces sp. JEL0680]
MALQIDLKVISSAISSPPFEKNWSIIQLHDEISAEQLLATVYEVAAFVDEASSPTVFLQDKEHEEKILRLAEFLQMLKYEPATSSIDSCVADLMALKRETLLSVLTFFFKDLASHKKRAYLALFLATPDVPADFLHDDVIVSLSTEMVAVQEEFKLVHKTYDGLKNSGQNAAVLKREIQMMEEEKQQITAKLAKIQKRVQVVPKADLWLQAGKNLRSEQLREMELEDRLKDQTAQTASADRKHSQAAANLKSAKDKLNSSSPDSIFSLVEEEHRMNKFLATVNIPKSIADAETKIKDLNDIIAREVISEVDIGRIEKEIADTSQINSQLAEQKLKMSSTGDANLALFRQQAAIIAAKKEGTLSKLNAVAEELQTLQQSFGEKAANSASGKKMLIGDDFKRYVSELRGKSTQFKRKKAELSSISTEHGILQRTKEILQRKEQDLQEALLAAETRKGIVGFHEAQEHLVKVSELKSEKDEEKGKKLQEISDIIQKLVQTINGKKNSLAPVIQNLRALRQEAQEIQAEYDEKKRIYDSTMELDSLRLQVDTLKQEIRAGQSKYHQLNHAIQNFEISQDRVMNEMKAYIGADEMIELVQKARGFKTYRELYAKKIAEGENAAKMLKIQQREAKASYEPNLRQISMFMGVQRLLDLKLAHNKKVLSGKALEENVGVLQVTQDRLVLS